LAGEQNWLSKGVKISRMKVSDCRPEEERQLIERGEKSR